MGVLDTPRCRSIRVLLEVNHMGPLVRSSMDRPRARITPGGGGRGRLCRPCRGPGGRVLRRGRRPVASSAEPFTGSGSRDYDVVTSIRRQGAVPMLSPPHVLRGRPAPIAQRDISTSLGKRRASMGGRHTRPTPPIPRRLTCSDAPTLDGSWSWSEPGSAACHSPPRGSGRLRGRSAPCRGLSRHIGRHRPGRRASPGIRTALTGRRSECFRGRRRCTGGAPWVSDFRTRNCSDRWMTSVATTRTASAARGLPSSARRSVRTVQSLAPGS
jgi:hypothetical protein